MGRSSCSGYMQSLGLLQVWRAGYVLAAFLAGRRPTIPPEAKPSFEAGTKLPIDGILDLTEYYGGARKKMLLPRAVSDANN